MLKKEGYALVNKNERYLNFEQINSRDVEIYSYEDIDLATLFDNETEAFQLGLDLRKGKGDFKFWIHEEDYPVKVVKIIKIYDIEDIKEI